MNCVNKQYCSATIAVLCDGHVTPCATIRNGRTGNIHTQPSLRRILAEFRDELIFKEFKQLENRPVECRVCNLAEECWGCRSRAFAAGLSIYGKDPRCYRSEGVPG
jgi:radical SAM protein with 4Fe4S-binding SPASM domain